MYTHGTFGALEDEFKFSSTQAYTWWLDVEYDRAL